MIKINGINYYDSTRNAINSIGRMNEKNYFCALYKHNVLGDCLILTKERNGRYHLLGGSGNIHSQVKELDDNMKISGQPNYLCTYKSSRNMVNLFSGQLNGKTTKLNTRYRLPKLKKHNNREKYFPNTRRNQSQLKFDHMVEDVEELYRNFNYFGKIEKNAVKSLLRDAPEVTGVVFYPLGSGRDTKGNDFSEIRGSLKSNMTNTAINAVDYMIRNRKSQPKESTRSLILKEDGSTRNVMSKFSIELSELFQNHKRKRLRT